MNRAAVNPNHSQRAEVSEASRKLLPKKRLDINATCASTYAVTRLTIIVMAIGAKTLPWFFFRSILASLAHDLPKTLCAYQTLPTAIELNIAATTATRLTCTSIVTLLLCAHCTP